MTAPDMQRREEVVRSYFRLLSKILEGDEKAVDEILNLWDEDGSIEFQGPPPLVAEFRGRAAVEVWLRNRLKVRGMPIKITGTGGEPAGSLTITRINLIEVRAVGEKIVAPHETTVGTDGERGFTQAGHNVFTFRGDKIFSVKVVLSPKPEAAEGLKLEELGVLDVGRLSLAAWAVV
jgi:hypothetical protein